VSTWDERSLLEDLLARGVDDWVYEAEVYDIARRSGLGSADGLRQLSVGLITEALVRGFAVAGAYDGTGHQPWDCSVGEAVERIAAEWLKWGSEVPTPGAIVWLDVTPAGLEVGEAVLARERD
jgi:hypothetical protein